MVEEGTANAIWTYETPNTYDEAVNGPDRDAWIPAIMEEYASLVANNTWDKTLYNLPEGRKAMSCKWIFKWKTNEKGEKVRAKARLVARGYTQIKGIDYEETFSPVGNNATFLIILALTVLLDLTLFGNDIKTAFLYADLEAPLYMNQIEGFVVEKLKGKVLRLQKSIYGIKQAARDFNQHLHKRLLDSGMKQSSFDRCLYYAHDDEGGIIVLATHVDDILGATNSEKLRTKLEEVLRENYEITSAGVPKMHCGMEIIVVGDKMIQVSQEAYIAEKLKEFGMMDCKGNDYPMETGCILKSASEKETMDSDRLPYRELVGAILFAANKTRPDISFATNMCCRFFNAYGETHWKAAKRILAYLKETRELAMTFDGEAKPNAELEVYVDADWASDPTDRVSISGWVIKLAGGVIMAKSTKQQAVARSTANAEYYAMGDCVQDVIWVMNILSELNVEMKTPIINEDNQACIKILEGNLDSQRLKHVDVRFRFVEEYIKVGAIKLKYCKTEEMVADILTKALGKQKFMKHVEQLGLKKAIRDRKLK